MVAEMVVEIFEEMFVALFNGALYAALCCFTNLIWMVDEREENGK